MEELLIGVGLLYVGASVVAAIAPHTKAGRWARWLALDLQALVQKKEPPTEPKEPGEAPPKD